MPSTRARSQAGRRDGTRLERARPNSAPVLPAILTAPVARISDRLLILGAAAGAVALLVVFREFLFSRGVLIAGDIGDNRFLIAILEHWFAAIRGRVAPGSPNFFWPEPHVLGYSEVVVLFAFPYSLARFLGFDRYLAFEITLILIKAAGFASMMWLLRSFVRVSGAVATVGAVLFTIASREYQHIGHAQLAAVAFCPLIVALACAGRRARSLGRPRAAACALGAAGALMAILLYTSFYIAWFGFLFLAVVTVIAAAGKALRGRSVAALAPWYAELRSGWREYGSGLAMFVLASIPFWPIYLPALRSTGGRLFVHNQPFLACRLDTVNVGFGNLVWGRFLDPLWAWFHAVRRGGELEVGWPPLFLAVAFLCAAYALWKVRGPAPPQASLRESRLFLAAVLFCSSGLLWFTASEISGHTPWVMVFRFIPGATAIRVPVRVAALLNTALVVVVSIALHEIVSRSGPWPKAVFGVLVCCLLVEEVNVAHTHNIDRASERAIFAKISMPPAGCSAFYLTHGVSRDRPFFASEVDAMLIARDLGIPTLNGYSGWMPKGWSLSPVDDPSYAGNVELWAFMNGLNEGLCGLDLRDGAWSVRRTGTQ